MENVVKILMKKVRDEDKKYLPFFLKFLIQKKAYISYITALVAQHDRIISYERTYRLNQLIDQIVWIDTKEGWDFWQRLDSEFEKLYSILKVKKRLRPIFRIGL